MPPAPLRTHCCPRVVGAGMELLLCPPLQVPPGLSRALRLACAGLSEAALCPCAAELGGLPGRRPLCSARSGSAGQWEQLPGAGTAGEGGWHWAWDPAGVCTEPVRDLPPLGALAPVRGADGVWHMCGYETHSCLCVTLCRDPVRTGAAHGQPCMRWGVPPPNATPAG